MWSKIVSKLSLQRAEEQLVLGAGRRIDFKITTDSAFGGKSTARFDDNKFFRGELVGEIPFAAIRAPLPKDVQDIGDFRGVNLRVRTRDKRNFSLNLQTPSFFQQDLYQAFIVLPQPNKFYELSLPFKDFLLTGKGRVREVQRELDTHTLTTIGVSVGGQESQPGTFELEIDYIKWVKEV